MSNGSERSNSGATPARTEKAGITVVRVMPATAQGDSIPPEQRGVIATGIDKRGAAYHSGVAQGPVITKVLGPGAQKAIRSPSGLDQALQKLHSGDVTSLLVYIPSRACTIVLSAAIGE